jgi:hypothetical protein
VWNAKLLAARKDMQAYQEGKKVAKYSMKFEFFIAAVMKILLLL